MKRHYITKTLIVLWVGVIFMNSLLPGEVSSRQSGFVVNVLNRFFGLFNYEPDVDELSSIIRMVAHFIEFAVLGFFIRIEMHQKPYQSYLMLIFGFSIALIDELIQLGVPGRAFQLTDLLIDWSGVVLGIIITSFYFKIISKKNNLLEE